MSVVESILSVLGRVLKSLIPADATGEDRRRRGFLVGSGLALLLAFIFIEVVAITTRGLHAPSLVLMMAGICLFLGQIWAARHAPNPIMWGRATVASLMVLLTLDAFDYPSTSILWAFLLPSGTIFLFGAREGAVWAALSLLVSVVLLGVAPAHWPADWDIRFLIALTSVSALSLFQERSRDKLLGSLVCERDKLDEVLTERRALSGLLPICAGCKSVRDDKGFWTSIERHLARYPNARLVEAVCPSCTPTREEAVAPALGEEVEEDDVGEPVLTIEERRERSRRGIVGWLAGGLFVVMIFFGILHATRGLYAELGLVCVVQVYVTATLVMLWRGHRSLWLVRVSALFLLGTTSAGLLMGGEFRYLFMWFYLLPPAYAYLLGSREGVAWCLSTLVASLMNLRNSGYSLAETRCTSML